MTTTNELTYLLWQDIDPKKAPAQKIAEACAHYQQKYGVEATVCLVNQLWAGVQVNGLDVRVESHVRPNTVWVGVQ